MYKKAVLPSFASSVFLLVIVLYGIYTFNFLLIFFAYVFSWILQAALLFLILKTESNLSLSTHNFLPFMKGLIAASWPLGLMLIFNLLYSRSDVVLLSLFQPTADVGVYGVSYRFFEIGLALPTFLANSTYPLLLKNKDNTRNYMTLFRKYIFLYIVLSLVTTILAFVFSPLIGFFKNGFQLSILPLQLLTLSLPFFFLTSLLQWHFLIRNKLKFLIPLYAAILVINLTLNMLLIPRFSYYAAAATTVLCEGLVFAIMLWHFIRSSKQSA